MYIRWNKFRFFLVLKKKLQKAVYMFKKINISIAIISLIILSGCDKDKGLCMACLGTGYPKGPSSAPGPLYKGMDKWPAGVWTSSNLNTGSMNNPNVMGYSDGTYVTNPIPIPEGTAECDDNSNGNEGFGSLY